MPETSAHPPRRSEPSNEQTDLSVCWGSVSAGNHFERDWRSKQSRVGKGPAWGPARGPGEGYPPAPPPRGSASCPSPRLEPNHIYISQQMAGRTYNNAITRMRFSAVLGTQGLRPQQIQSLLIYPACLQIKRRLPLPQGGLPAQPSQGSRAHTHRPGEASWLSGHWRQDGGLLLGSPSSSSLEAPGLGQAAQRALHKSCPLLDLDEFRGPHSSSLHQTPGSAHWRPSSFCISNPP